MERESLSEELESLLTNPAGRSFAVVGLGEQSGVSAANFLAAKGAKVLASDIKAAQDLAGPLSRLDPRVRVETGGHSPGVYEVEAAVAAPGLPPQSPVYRALGERGVPIVGEAQLAALHLRGRIAGVTGTKGKSTTTSLIARGGRDAFHPSAAGGNLAPPAVDLVAASKDGGLSVLELSSFQLALCRDLRLSVAVVTNFGADHLDRYTSLEEYRDDKLRIVSGLGTEGTLVLPWGDPQMERFHAACRGRLLWFGQGPNIPQGCLVRDDRLILRLGGRERSLAVPDGNGLEAPHQRLNLAGALCALHALGVEPENALAQIKGYEGLPGRVEKLGSLKGVTFINDTQGTDLVSLGAALKMGGGKIRLLVGGIFKGGDLESLRTLVAARAAAVYAYGRDRGRFLDAWRGAVTAQSLENLGEAFAAALSDSREGETLLLSPACSSFDQFGSAKERGALFKSLVEAAIRNSGGETKR